MIKAAVFLLLVIWRWPIIYEQVTIDLVADAQLVADFCGGGQMSAACRYEMMARHHPAWFIATGKLTVEVGVIVFMWLLLFA